MKMSSISGVVNYVKDLDKTAEFYESLGFRIGKRDAEQLTCYVNWFWIILKTQDQEESADAKKAAYKANRGSGTSLHIKVEDINAFYEGVVAKGMKPESEPQAKPGGTKEFVLRDPDGYNLVFFWKK